MLNYLQILLVKPGLNVLLIYDILKYFLYYVLQKLPDHGKDSNLVSLCFSLSLIGRRTLGAASHNTLSRYIVKFYFRSF